MKIDLLKLPKGKTTNILITGKEPWLESIYKDFEQVSGASGSQSHLKGAIDLTLTDENHLQISGQVSYNPPTNCGRCEKKVPLALNENLHIFIALNDCLTKPADSCMKDSGEYFIENKLNIATIINEALVLGLPSSTRKTTDEGNCFYCHKDISKPMVYTSSAAPQKPDSPFAQLLELQTTTHKKH